MRKLFGFCLAAVGLFLASLFLSVPEPMTGQAQAQPWSNAPDNLGNCPQNAASLRGSGRSYTCFCNAGATSSGSVWGSYVYTDDSAICRAAVHAGAIGPGGGQVTFSSLPGQSSYSGSNSNGVPSSNYGGWQGSFQFAASAPPPPRQNFGGGNQGGGYQGGQAVAAASACPANMSAMRGRNGQSMTCGCSAGDAASGSVWGTSIYTDDSNVCRAALHAGLIGPSGGTVAVTVAPGQSSYAGSNRNGVSSSNYASWQGSFTLGYANAAPGSTRWGGGSGGGLRAPVAPAPPPAWTANNIGACPGNVSAYRGSGGSYSCYCDGNATGSGSVWGTNVYTDDSAICRAAVHAGRIGPGGGQVNFAILPGQASYYSSTSNGISSSDYGSWQGSFRFVP